MADTQLVINIAAGGHEEVRRILKGIAKEAKFMERSIQKDIERTDAMRRKSFMRQKSMVTGMMSHIRRAEMQKRNEYRRTGRELYDSIATQTKKAVAASRQFLSRHAGAIQGIAIAGAVGGRSAYNRAAQFSGLPSQAEAFQRVRNYRLEFAQFANAAGLSADQRKAMAARFAQRTRETSVTEAEQLGGARVVQAAMGPSGLATYEANLDLLTNINQSLGVPLESLAGVVVELQRQFQIAAEDLPEAIGFMVEAANEGSIEVENFATDFRPVMGLFAQNFGTGMEKWKELVTTGETLGTTFGSTEAGVRLTRAGEVLTTMRATRSGQGYQAARRAGLDVNATPLEFARQVADKGWSPEKISAEMSKVFSEQRARQGIMTLITQLTTANKVLGSDWKAGTTRAAADAAAIRENPAFLQQKREAEILLNVNDQFEKLAIISDKIAGQWQALASQNVVLAQSLGVVAEVAQAIGMLAIAKNVLAGGGGAPGVGGGFFGALGKGAGVGAGAAGLGAQVLGVGAAGAAGYGVGQLIRAGTDWAAGGEGKGSDKWLEDLFWKITGGGGFRDQYVEGPAGPLKSQEEYARMQKEAAEKQLKAANRMDWVVRNRAASGANE